jgi:site-specific recombinase XerD
MRHRMVIENLSPRTIRSYMHYPLKLAEYFNAVPQDLTTDEIYAFLVYLKEDRGLSRSTVHIAVSGIRYFYQHILKRSSIIEDVPYPKREKYLPEILSGMEVKRLFVLTKNIKHKALLMLAYSAGLRRGEIIGLRLVDIDRKNMQLNIRKGKGNKDRKAILSRYLLGVLEQYYRSYHPEQYLFNGRRKSEPISEGAINWAFRQAIKRTGIKKDLSLHNLRHSFASHLLSMGVSLLDIQMLLGHSDIRTTMVYLHLNRRRGTAPCSPLDILFR